MFNWFKKKKFDIRKTRIVIEGYEFIPLQQILFYNNCDWYHYNIKKTSIKNDVITRIPYNRIIIEVDENYSMFLEEYPGSIMKKGYKILTFDELKICINIKD